MKSCSWLAVFKRETAAYFDSSVATIFLLIFSALAGGLFMTTFFLVNQAEMRFFFDLLPWLLCIFLSAVTMRAWAEDRRGNTLELLLTFPMKTSSLVAGKFFAALFFYVIALATTFLIPVMLFTLGSPDLGQMAAAYAGALCLGAFFLAGGFFISGFCRDQIVAFVITLLFCLGLYLFGQDIVAETLDGWISGFGTWLRTAFGVEPHYAVFTRGITDLRDVVFFLSGAFLLLMLNAFWMDSRSRRGSKAVFITASVMCLGIFIFLNGALSGVSCRLDWSEGKIYTMAESSRKILKKLQAPAVIKLYISPRDKMPTAFKTFERDLVSKLDELRLAAGGKLKYEVIHMEASNALDSKQAENTAEAQITKKGVYPFQVQSIESDQVEVKLIYAAMTISYLEKPEDIIPQIYPGDMASLEYKLVSKIYKMTFAQYPKIALVAPYEEKAINPETAALLAQLTGGKSQELQRDDQYEVLERILTYEGYPFDRITISEKQPLTNNYTALFLIEPRLLSDRQKYEINQFIRKGGSVFMAVQNYGFNYVPEGSSLHIEPKMDRPQVNDLLSAWGLSVSENLLLDESNETVSVSGGGIFDVTIPVKLPVQIMVPPQGFNSKAKMMAHPESLFYLWGTALHQSKKAVSALTYTPLFFSSELSQEIALPQGRDFSPADLKSATAIDKGPFPLGMLAEGVFPDAFNGKPVPAWEESTDSKSAAAPKKPENAGETFEAKPGKLIIVGSSTMFQNNLIKGGGHYHFIMNMLDSLTFGEDLVGIRAKHMVDRTMTRISRGEKQVWRLLTTFFVPLILIILSVYRLFAAARVKQKYLKTLTA